MANTHKKYNGDGSINKIWAYVEQEEYIVESMLQYAYSQNQQNIDNKYESVFQFMKRHCPDKSDSEIAMEVLHSLK